MADSGPAQSGSMRPADVQQIGDGPRIGLDSGTDGGWQHCEASSSWPRRLRPLAVGRTRQSPHQSRNASGSHSISPRCPCSSPATVCDRSGDVAAGPAGYGAVFAAVMRNACFQPQNPTVLAAVMRNVTGLHSNADQLGASGIAGSQFDARALNQGREFTTWGLSAGSSTGRWLADTAS